MDTTLDQGATATRTAKEPARQAYEILHWGFVAAPVIAGIDIVLRDFGLCLGALALARLSVVYDVPRERT